MKEGSQFAGNQSPNETNVNKTPFGVRKLNVCEDYCILSANKVSPSPEAMFVE
jgi:hypothetical protein